MSRHHPYSRPHLPPSSHLASHTPAPFPSWQTPQQQPSSSHSHPQPLSHPALHPALHPSTSTKPRPLSPAAADGPLSLPVDTPRFSDVSAAPPSSPQPLETPPQPSSLPSGSHNSVDSPMHFRNLSPPSTRRASRTPSTVAQQLAVSRLQVTDPPSLPPKHAAKLFSAASPHDSTTAPPLDPAVAAAAAAAAAVSGVSSNPPSRPDTPSETEPSSSRPSESALRLPSDLAESTSEFEPNLLSESRTSDALLSSAEPSSINACAQSHIDPSALEYDFDQLDTRIGVGTYGSVYVGTYFNHLVAIKRIHLPSVKAHIHDDPYVSKEQADAIRKFAREIRRYERVNHPGIVQFFGVTLPSDNCALLVTELMKGGSLGVAINKKRRDRIHVNLSSALRIAVQACSGLRALHDLKCTWGDAKPENILLSDLIDDNGEFPPSAEARIADFGLSKSVGQTLLAGTTLVGSGNPAGNYNFVAPEVMLGGDTDDLAKAMAADIFSFAMVIFEMLTLRTPWKGYQMTRVYDALRKGERPAWPAPGDSDYREIPPELRDIIERCWLNLPDKRPKAEEVFFALKRVNAAFTNQPEQRPVAELTQQNNVTDGESINIMNSSTGQGTMSTVVAIGDTTDLGSNMLESTSESRRLFQVPEPEVEDDDSAESASEPVRNPTVSPVTSPEPRPKKAPIPDVDPSNLESTFGTQSQVSPVVRPLAVGTTYVEGKRVVEVISPKAEKKSFLQSYENGAPAQISSDRESGGIEDNVPEEPASIGMTNMSSTEFQKQYKNLNRFSRSSALPSSEMLDDEATRLESLEVLDSTMAVTSNPSGLSGSFMYGSTEAEVLSSNTSRASGARKSSERMKQMIVEAACEILEQRRRKNRISPKQRKELIEKRAEQEAKMNSEKEALAAIDKAKEEGNFSVVLQTMSDHRESLSVARAGCVMIEKHCADEAIYFDICEENGIEKMLDAANIHGRKDVTVASSFCRSMKALSKHYNEKVGHMIRGLGVPSLVVELLQGHHQLSVEVQTSGCKCLAVIAESSELSRSAVATLGGPNVIYRAMRNNHVSFKDIGLARAILEAIRYIAQDNEKAAQYLVDVCALDAVSHCAEVFTNHGLEKDILMALRAFSFYDGGRRNVILSSGLTALASIMLRNKEPEFLVQCCTFVRAIARWRDHQCEEAMLGSSISERITWLMQMSNDIMFEEGAKVAWYSCHAGTFLASFGSRSRKRLREVGAIEATINIMKSRIDNSRVVHSATDALAELLKGEPDSKRHAEQLNVTKVLKDAMEHHRGVGQVRNALQWTLTFLASQNGGGVNGANGLYREQDTQKLANRGNVQRTYQQQQQQQQVHQHQHQHQQQQQQQQQHQQQQQSQQQYQHQRLQQQQQQQGRAPMRGWLGRMRKK